MNEVRRLGVLMEVMQQTLQTVLEYVQQIPQMQQDISTLKDHAERTNHRLSALEGHAKRTNHRLSSIEVLLGRHDAKLANHEKRLTKLEG